MGINFKGGSLGQISAIDKKWVIEDPNYNVEKNRAVIEQTITDYEALRAKKAKEQDEPYAERADAVVSFLRSLDRASSTGIGASTNIEKYFGRRTLAKLRGDEIRQKLMAGMGVVTPDGHILKRSS